MLPSGRPCITGGGIRTRPAVTNNLQFYNALGTAPWSTQVGGTGTISVTNNSTDVLAPDGSQTATKVVFNGSGVDTTIIFQAAPATVATDTFSAYMRTLSGSCTVYGLENPSAPNMQALTVTGSWTRYSQSISIPGTGSFFEIGKQSGNGPVSCTVYVWGAQLETSTSFAGDICPTVGASATCNGETLATSAAIPNLSTSFCASSDVSPVWSSNLSYAFGNGISTANTWYLRWGATLYRFVAFDSVPNSKQWDFTIAQPSAGSTHHVRLCYGGTSSSTPSLWFDGVAQTPGAPSGTGTGLSSNTAVISPAGSNIATGALTGTGANFCIGNDATSGVCP